jgi:hypothetical protein
MMPGSPDNPESWIAVPNGANGNEPPEPRITALRSTWMLAPRWMMAAAGIFLGTLLAYRAVSSYLAAGFDRGTAASAFAGMLCYLCSGMDRMFYLSDGGIVSETYCWGHTIRKMAPWNAVRGVWLIPGNRCFTAAFEVGARVLKLPFPKDSAGEVEDLLEEFLPDDARIKRPAH